jgi:cell division protein FtsZ
MPVIDAAALSGQADPIAANDPLAVALDLGNSENTGEVPTISTPRRKITFEELVVEDEIDIPDFMK